MRSPKITLLVGQLCKTDNVQEIETVKGEAETEWGEAETEWGLSKNSS